MNNYSTTPSKIEQKKNKTSRSTDKVEIYPFVYNLHPKNTILALWLLECLYFRHKMRNMQPGRQTNLRAVSVTSIHPPTHKSIHPSTCKSIQTNIFIWMCVCGKCGSLCLYKVMLADSGLSERIWGRGDPLLGGMCEHSDKTICLPALQLWGWAAAAKALPRGKTQLCVNAVALARPALISRRESSHDLYQQRTSDSLSAQTETFQLWQMISLWCFQDFMFHTAQVGVQLFRLCNLSDKSGGRHPGERSCSRDSF